MCSSSFLSQLVALSVWQKILTTLHRNDKATLATNGFAADAEALVSRIRQRLELYRHAHGRSMPLHAIARMISTILYSKRFFPYYVYNILGGLDEQGKGAVYSFDPVGSYEREFCRAAGAAQSLIQPFLDNQVRRSFHT